MVTHIPFWEDFQPQNFFLSFFLADVEKHRERVKNSQYLNEAYSSAKSQVHDISLHIHIFFLVKQENKKVSYRALPSLHFFVDSSGYLLKDLTCFKKNSKCNAVNFLLLFCVRVKVLESKAFFYF